MQRSPSWMRAEDLAQAVETFSVAACRAALQRVGNDMDAAAVLLLEQGAALEAEVAAAVTDVDEAPLESTDIVDDDDDIAIRTVSFRPASSANIQAPSPPRAIERPATSRENFSMESKIEFDDVRTIRPLLVFLCVRVVPR